ncbi:MAG: hypothetical protein RLZZ241_1162 [Bacteroidota bacterium]
MPILLPAAARRFALMGALIFALGNCSQVPEIDDPVIGIWAKTYPQNGNTIREEWIFNDVYLGRYQKYQNQTITVKSDFSWNVNQSVYTISYPALNREPELVTITHNEETMRLETNSGDILAERE